MIVYTPIIFVHTDEFSPGAPIKFQTKKKQWYEIEAIENLIKPFKNIIKKAGYMQPAFLIMLGFVINIIYKCMNHYNFLRLTILLFLQLKDSK
jgi:hypothetical protein